MRYILPLLFLLAIAVLLTGCEAENPVCTDNFCFVGEAFLRSDLDTEQPFSEIDVDDSVIFATLTTGTIPTPVETPAVETTPQTDTTLSEIVADVAANGENSAWIGQTVTVTGAVKFNLTRSLETTSTVTLYTHNDNVGFFIFADNQNTLANLGNGTTYTFEVTIDRVSPSSSNPDINNVFADNLSQPTEADVSIIDVSIADLVSDAKNDRQYVGKTVRTTASVFISNAELDNSGAIALSSPDFAVSILVYDLVTPANINRYRVGTTYTFTLYIISMEADEDNPREFDIEAAIADD